MSKDAALLLLGLLGSCLTKNASLLLWLLSAKKRAAGALLLGIVTKWRALQLGLLRSLLSKDAPLLLLLGLLGSWLTEDAALLLLLGLLLLLSKQAKRRHDWPEGTRKIYGIEVEDEQGSW